MTTIVDRRQFLALSALFAASTGLPAQARAPADDEHVRMMETVPPDAPNVAMLIHPKMIALDLIGPMTIFKIARFKTQLVWKDKTPVSTDIGIPIIANQTFEECASDVDVLFVPGGIMGSIACMNDPAVINFLSDRGSRAKWVTSVCTGGLVLAAAGLLKGYDATAHWGVANLLPLMGARHVDKRVVKDRNRMTGAGATAGLDFGLTLVSEIKGEELARRIQFILEYAPEPPFQNGSPAQAGPERTRAMRASRLWMDQQARAAAEQAASRLALVG